MEKIFDNIDEHVDMLLEAAYKSPVYKDFNAWYQDLIKYIIVDPEINKKPLNEKIRLFKQIRTKLKAEIKNPSGWSKYFIVLKTIIPYLNIYQYFTMNGNQEALVWLLNSDVPIPSISDQKSETKYKNIFTKMINQTNQAISILERKLQLFDEKAAKQNPLVANQNVLYKIDKHFG